MATKDRKGVMYWKQQIRNGVKYLDDYGYKSDWVQNTAFYRMQFESNLPYNLIFGMARALIPNIYFRNPRMVVNPTNQPNMYMHAKLLEGLDNYLISALDIKSMIKSCILDNYLCGISYCKVGYDSEFGFSKADIETNPDVLAAGLTDGTLTKTSLKGERVEYNTRIRPGFPWANRIKPSMIVVPFGTKTLSNAEWVAHLTLRPLEDIKADTKYSNTADLKGSAVEFVKETSQHSVYNSDLGRDLVELVEIRDYKTNQISVFAAGESEKWLREPQEDALQIGGLPILNLSWSEDPDFIWGLPDASLIAPQQNEMNDCRDQAQEHRRKATLKLIADKSMKLDMDKLESAKVGTILEGQNVDPSKVIQMQPAIPGDLIAWISLLREDVRELLGFGRNQLGEYEQTGRRTKGEAMLVAQGGAVRLDEKRDAVADFIVAVMKKVNQVIFSLWTAPKVVQLVGQDGFLYWVDYTPSAIKGDYNLRLDVEAMSPSTKQARKTEMLEVISLLGKNPNIPIDYLLRLLSKEYEWLDLDQLFPSGGQVGFNQFAQAQGNMGTVAKGRAQSLPMLQGRVS